MELFQNNVNGKIIARLNNYVLLNFRAFRIYLWLKIVVVAHGHIIQYRIAGNFRGCKFS